MQQLKFKHKIESVCELIIASTFEHINLINRVQLNEKFQPSQDISVNTL